MSRSSGVRIGPPKRTKARKEHTCTSCGSKIEAGAIYFRENQFLVSLSRHVVEVCETCYDQGRFDLHFLEQQNADQRKGTIDRYL